MATWIIGDTHFGTGDEQKLLNLDITHDAEKGDYVIICGDSGFIWNGNDDPNIPSNRDFVVLKQVSELGFNILVCPGNHCNYDALERYPIVKYCGASAYEIRKNIHFMIYGEIYDIEGKRFWNCGGAASIDKAWRTPHKSWWPQEVPDKEIVDKAVANFESNIPDYAITHATPIEITAKILHQYALKIGPDTYMCNQFQYLLEKYPQVEWHCGHMHIDDKYDNCYIHYNDVFKVG